MSKQVKAGLSSRKVVHRGQFWFVACKHGAAWVPFSAPFTSQNEARSRLAA